MSTRPLPPAVAASRRDDGFTLVELLIAIVMVGVVTGAAVSAFALAVRTGGTTSDRVRKSNDAEVIASFLVKDAASAGAYGPNNGQVNDAFNQGLQPGVRVASSTTGFCGDAAATPVVRFEWVETNRAGTSRRVAANYGLDTNAKTLVRRGCSQPIASGATATESVAVIGRNVQTASASCRPSCTNPSSVTLGVTETVNPQGDQTPYSFSVTGFLRTGGDGDISAQVAPFIALGVTGNAACATPATSPQASGLAVGSNGLLQVYGIAAVDSANAPCGNSVNLATGASVVATQNMVIQGGTVSGTGTVTPAVTSIPSAILDPYSTLQAPAEASQCGTPGNNPAYDTGFLSRTYKAGVYRQPLNLDFGLIVNFEPGVYVFCQGMTVSVLNLMTTVAGDNGTPEGSLFYFAGGTLTINQDNFLLNTINLKGLPASDPRYPNMLIWQPRPTAPTNTGDIVLTAGSLWLNIFPQAAAYDGVIYAPNAQVSMSGPSTSVEGTAQSIVARNVYIGPNGRLRVGPGPQSTTSLTVSPTPSNLGQSVTLRATVTAVAPATGTPTGQVTFYDGGAAIGTPVTLNNGVATTAIASLAGGPHDLRAVYSGNPGTFAASVSPIVSHIVNQAATTMTLTSSPDPSGLGQPATFTATVTGVAGVPATGNVEFREGATVLGTAPLVNNVARFTTSALTLGNHQIVAVYAGDVSYLGSQATDAHTVLLGTTTTVTSDVNPSYPTQNVTLTATVNAFNPPPGAPPVTGTVTFYDGLTPLGTVGLNGATAQLTVPFAAGGHSITAAYNGSPNYAGSTSAVYTQNVSQANTVTTLARTVGTSPSIAGDSLTFVATVTGPNGAPTPTGTVTFRDLANGNQVLGTVNLAGGAATLQISNLSVGTHSISSTYNGSTIYNPSTSNTVQQDVNKLTPTVVVSSNANPSVAGANVTFTVTVTGAAGTPTGNVTFSDGGSPLGTRSLFNGQATLSTTNLSGGTHAITVQYAGNATYNNATSNTLTQTVNRANTSITLVRTGGSGNVSYGTAIGLQATVTNTSNNGADPTGIVTFYDGATPIASAPLSPFSANQGRVTVTVSSLSVGTHSAITASYAQTTDFNASGPSSPITSFAVTKATPTVTVSSNANPSLLNSPVTFSVSVSGNPTGTVQLNIDGSNVGAPVALDANGDATFPAISSLTAGNHTVRATYSGDTNYNGVTSANITQRVARFLLSQYTANTPDSFTLTITGAGFTNPPTVTFTAGSGCPSRNYFGGITVQSPTRVNSTTMSVRLTVDRNATTCLRNIRVQSGSFDATENDIFTVQ